MSDPANPTNVAPIEWRQRYADDIETMETHLDGRQAQIHTMLPGRIVSYDPSKMTASVQIAVQGVHQQLDGTKQAVTIQPVSDVPVHFPGGGGHTMTFPIKKDDECMVVFASRNIDAWHQQGGIQQPPDFRMHDINDCFVLVGTRSQPRVLPNVNPNAVQLRSDNGAVYIEMNGSSGAVAIKCQTLTVNASTSITMTSPKIDLNP